MEEPVGRALRQATSAAAGAPPLAKTVVEKQGVGPTAAVFTHRGTTRVLAGGQPRCFSEDAGAIPKAEVVAAVVAAVAGALKLRTSLVRLTGGALSAKEQGLPGEGEGTLDWRRRAGPIEVGPKGTAGGREGCISIRRAKVIRPLGGRVGSEFELSWSSST